MTPGIESGEAVGTPGIVTSSPRKVTIDLHLTGAEGDDFRTIMKEVFRLFARGEKPLHLVEVTNTGTPEDTKEYMVTNGPIQGTFTLCVRN